MASIFAEVAPMSLRAIEFWTVRPMPAGVKADGRDRRPVESPPSEPVGLTRVRGIPRLDDVVQMIEIVAALIVPFGGPARAFDSDRRLGPLPR
jgi:hypothetical protein